jgi:hypothetical protein
MIFPHDLDHIVNANQGDFIFDGVVRHDHSLRGLADDVCDAESHVIIACVGVRSLNPGISLQLI